MSDFFLFMQKEVQLISLMVCHPFGYNTACTRGACAENIGLVSIGKSPEKSATIRFLLPDFCAKWVLLIQSA